MKVSEINIYPVKSLKGIRLAETMVEKRGLRHDRRWMLSDPDGMFITQRQVPRMAAVTVKVENGELRVESDASGEIRIPFEPDQGHRQNVIVWQSEVQAEVYPTQINQWFSEVLGSRCQLVVMPESSTRPVNERFDKGGDIVSFADGYPMLLANEASLEELNARIAGFRSVEVSAGKLPAFQPIPMDRFRPNIVVTGAEAFEEDRWARIKIGEEVFRVVKPCARCVIPTIDQLTGEFDGNEPSRTLASFRRARQVYPYKFAEYAFQGNEVLFATNLIPEDPNTTIRTGDRVEVLDAI